MLNYYLIKRDYCWIPCVIIGYLGHNGDNLAKMATITKRESGRWQAKVRRGGGAPISRTFRTAADAEAWARKQESEIERGVWHDAREAEKVTLTECLDRYAREWIPKKSDPARERSHADTLRTLPFAGRSMARIRSVDIAAARDAWAKSGHAPATIARRFAVLSRIFNLARREWGMESLANPMETVTKPRVANARERRVTDAEISAISAASGSRELGTFVQLAVETAMRRGELSTLRWKHVDLRARTAHLPRTKNGDSRTVPLSSRAVEILTGLPRRIDGRVLGLRPDSVTQAFDRACDRAGIERLTFHDLRHEATSRLANLLQAHELAKVTGHKDMRMVLRYYHPHASELAKKLG
jgi:integrase